VLVLRRVGSTNLARSEFSFAVGMMGVLFVWDVLVEFSVPGILLVAAAFAYLLYRLDRTLRAREGASGPSGARGVPPS
jgi:hypothetical protein